MNETRLSIGQLEGQIEQWELDIGKLQCEFKGAIQSDKEECLKKIKDLELKISDAADKLERIKTKSELDKRAGLAGRQKFY
jgi:hypothetical protein